MNSITITITLKETDLTALQEVLIDDDPAAALAFVKEHICPKIPEKGSSPCDSTRLNPYLFKRRGAEGAGGKKDNVVDADFEVVDDDK